MNVCGVSVNASINGVLFSAVITNHVESWKQICSVLAKLV